MSPHLPHPKLCISCWSLDHSQQPSVFREDFYFPVSAEWKQQLKPQRLPHHEFLWQLLSYGNFKRAFSSLESKNIPMNSDFHLQWSTVSMNCNVGVGCPYKEHCLLSQPLKEEPKEPPPRRFAISAGFQRMEILSHSLI